MREHDLDPRPESNTASVAKIIFAAVIGCALSSAGGYFTAQSSSSTSVTATMSQLTAQVASLQTQVKSIRDDSKAYQESMATRFVSQDTFSEFKREYDANHAESHDFQVRIDSKLDGLLHELYVTPAPKARR